MVFQSYAIWPHMTVFENVAYGLRVRRKSAAEIEEKVRPGARSGADGQASPTGTRRQLSGGQQQRVALARACAFSPSVLLFDEPLSNLDAKLRGDMRIELRELQHRLGVTSLYVTHDLEEALAMSDRIVVMRAGHIEQTGTPARDLQLSAHRIRRRLRRLRQPDHAAVLRPDLASGDTVVALETDGGQIVYGVAHGAPAWPRADDVGAHRASAPVARRRGDGRNVWPVAIQRSVFLGDLTQVHVDWGGRELVVRQTGIAAPVGRPARLPVRRSRALRAARRGLKDGQTFAALEGASHGDETVFRNSSGSMREPAGNTAEWGAQDSGTVSG